MSFMNKIFGSAPASQQQSPAATQQANPGNIPMNASPMSPAGNGTVPANVDMGNKEPVVESPMAEFKDLFTMDPNAATKQQEPLFTIDPEKLAAAVKKNDFSKVIPAELMTRINAGGEEAQKAMVEAMNAMTQAGMMQNTVSTTKIIEQALEKQQKRFEEKLPEIIKNHTTRENLRSTNPILQNPATAPIFEAVLHQIQQKFPNSSAADHQKQAEMYITQFAEMAQAPEKAATAAKSKANDTDWGSFLDEANA